MKKILPAVLTLIAFLVSSQVSSASVCWKDNKAYYNSYGDCIGAINKFIDKQTIPAWCNGCNIGWSDSVYQECENKAATGWEKACAEEWLSVSCADNEKANSAGECICTDDSCCQTKFGSAIYNGNEADGCGCGKNSTFDGSTCACNEGYAPKNGTCVIGNKTDSECQQQYGIAHADSGTSTGCHCDDGAHTVQYSNGSYTCEWTQEHLDEKCKTEHGISRWNADINSCECMEYTELVNGKCEAESNEIVTARQELQYGVYRKILRMAISNLPGAREAANKLFGMGNVGGLAIINDSEIDADSIPYFEKLEFYDKQSVWKGLDEQQQIDKAVRILRGKKALVGKMNVIIEDSNTVYIQLMNTIGFLCSGTVTAYDTGSSKTTVYTPNSINAPKGTIFTVSYDTDAQKTETTVKEGSVAVVDTVSGITTNVAAGQSIATSGSSSNSSGSSFLDTIGYTGATGGTSSTSCFSDTAGHGYEDAICYVKNQDVVSGYADGTYKPDQEINRAEFTKIIMAATYDDGTITGSKCFSDVGDEWFGRFACRAKTLGIVGGYSNGAFGPQNSINLAESLKIILEAAAKVGGFTITNGNGAWYQKYIDLANQLGLLDTIDDNPSHNLTRGEMAEIVYRADGN